MDSKLRSKLLQQSSQGNFKLVNSIIITEKLELDDNTAAKVIIECCRIFYTKDVPTVEGNDLLELLLTCKQFIKTLSHDTFIGYLQSLYYIVKFWLTQKKYELVLGIKNLLFSQFPVSWKNDRLVKSYTGLSILIHNVVALLQRKKSENYGQLYCQLCMLALQMKSIISTNIVLANTAYSYFNSTVFLEAGIDSENNCYLTVLQLIMDSEDTKTNCNLSDMYSAIIKVLDIVIRNLFKKQEFSKIGEYITAITLAVEKLPDSKMYFKLFNSLYHTSQLVIKLEDNQDSLELFVNNLEQCLKDIKYCSNNYMNAVEVEKLFNLVYVIYFNILEYYSIVSPTIWTMFMKENIQIAICNLLASTGKFVAQIKGDCRVCTKCKVKENLYLAIMITHLAGNFFTISLKKQISVSNSMCHNVFRYFQRCCNLIKKLHSTGCSQWKTAWIRIGPVTYNVAIKLFSMKHNGCYNYFELLIKNAIHLEGVSGTSVINCDLLGNALQGLAEINIHNCQFKKALMYVAIGIFVSNDPTKHYKMWLNTKAKNKDSGIEEDDCLQELTIVCVLQLYENEIKDLYPDLYVKLKPEVKIKLLMDELGYYKRLWPSKRPMLGAFRRLSDYADLLTLVKVIIETWVENLEFAHNDVIKLLNEITSKFEFEIEKHVESKGDCLITEKNLYLALLYVMKYYAQIRIVRQKIVDDINNTVIPEQLPLPSYEMPKNPNDTCDLVTSYSSLKLSKHLKIMKLLSKVLTLLNMCVSDGTSPNIIELLKKYNVVEVVVKIAHEFRLHRDSLQAVQAWFLCLKISRLVNNNLCTLQAISFLIEEANMDSKVINDLIIEAENLEKDFTKFDFAEIWTTYHINKSIMLYRHQNMEAGFKEYEKAMECFLNIGENKDELLEIRLDFLHTWYLQLPCSLQMEGHDVFSLSKRSNVLNRITSYIKTSGPSSFATAIFFEVYEAVAHMYRWMCLPREVRCYCRDILVYAQGLVIPFQTAYFLVDLAHADLLSTRLNDCQVKLNGLSDLLCLDNNTKNFPYNEPTSADIAVKGEDIDVAKLVDNFAEIMLDCPSNDYKCDASTASPVLFKKRFQQPSFIKHSVDCDCFYCISVEYKILILEYINLEAQLQILHGNTTAAISCFNDGVELYRFFTKDDSFKTKITKHLSCYPLHDWKFLLCKSICSLLLNYANCLIRTNDIKMAELFNKKILNLVSKTKIEHFFIYNEALLQKYTITISMSEVANVNTKNYLSVNTEYSNNLNEIPKTPENKQTKVVVTTCLSPRPNSPPKRRLRKIKCDFSDQPENDHIKTDTDGSKNKSAKKLDMSEEKNNIKESSVLHNICKTPAPTCSAISGSQSFTTIKNCKPVLQEIPIPLPKIIVKNDNDSCCDDENSLCVIPSSPNAYTPNTLQLSSVLKSRTELLTKKLKKSPINKVLINDVCDNAHEKVSASSESGIPAGQVKASVCKNLMSELCAAETKLNTKRSYKKKSKNINNATSEVADSINTRRATRANSKVVNK